MSERPESRYVCGRAARWLPRALAGSILVAGGLVVSRLGGDTSVGGMRSLRTAIALAIVAIAWWILRRGGEVRLQVVLGPDAISFELPRHQASVAYEDLLSLRYEGPFGPSRSWLPAAVLSDCQEREWRLSGLLASGGSLVDELVTLSGREDLEAWVSVGRIRERMARASVRVRTGYAVCVTILLAGLVHSLR